jgi:hypothetical protein
MTEEQIKDGYERLDSTVHAPLDAVHRVEQRIRARRRHRRLGAAVGTLAVVAVVGGYAAVSSGRSDDGRGSVVAVEPPPPSLVMTRPDGSTVAFDDLTVTCEPAGSASGGAGGAGPTLIRLSSPMRLDGEQLLQPFVFIEGDAAALAQPRTFTLPVESADGSSELLPLTVFMADTEGAPDGNEVVSSAGSTGTVQVTRASCDPTPVLELAIDVTLVSEEQTADGQAKQSLALKGVVR